MSACWVLKLVTVALRSNLIMKTQWDIIFPFYIMKPAEGERLIKRKLAPFLHSAIVYELWWHVHPTDLQFIDFDLSCLAAYLMFYLDICCGKYIKLKLLYLTYLLVSICKWTVLQLAG